MTASLHIEKWVWPMVRSCWTFRLVSLRRVRDAWVKCALEYKECAT